MTKKYPGFSEDMCLFCMKNTTSSQTRKASISNYSLLFNPSEKKKRNSTENSVIMNKINHIQVMN